MSVYEPSMLVAGKQYTPERETRIYLSPTTGEPVTQIPLGTGEDVDRAVAAARAAVPVLAALSLDERANLLVKTAEAIRAKSDEFAKILAVEHGKTQYGDAVGEVEGSAAAMANAGAQARWLTESHYPLSTPNKRLLTVRRPRGVYGILTPWNFPLGIATQYYLGPGLAAGNSMVWLGAPSVNSTHALLAETIAEIWPAGALNFVMGDGPVVGQALASHPHVDAVGFTGSTPVGNAVQTAAIGKPAFLELGGNGPTIVLPDADIERAANKIATGSFTNAGQICTASGRIIAHASIATELAEAIAAESERFVLGDPRDRATTMGPVHRTELVGAILRQLEDAVTKGARVVTGGRLLDEAPTGNYLLPTVVDNVPHDVELHFSETFGPVAPIVHYESEEELRNHIAASSFGLHGGIFTRDVEKGLTLGESLRVGHVNINDTSAYWEPSIPAGGAAGANSGIGRSGGPWSVMEMTEVQTFTLELG
ncbi:aldehyde dehydrogenase family protein (plasmid) [Arthrobacter sp. zg-Y820]|uniref:aldehyde dehydrogenase family protein n=1 Tax=unclassified Arthrobacter TaxID=235627 RepID=UPI001E4DD094|nr:MULTISPECIES: aldehyde dehydrogenase family protein [unclassified Arthrobacter]MCC9198518.1 aldehyde dehydrogenase family protein [Arthrobacter sp. zg-Y820]MDK1281388.1 aldehyde dehydrogenase family protein [Arthrobacter sp. zg.Y820]WIB11265.1 aldehyde dehydrogenase family protein [Arthrobacter sp. zg-Y820]